jgi:hypothetical protein
VSLPIGPRWNRTPASEVGVRPNSASWCRQYIIDEVTRSAIHGHAFEGTWIDGYARYRCFHRIDDGISGIRIVYVATVVQNNLERLREPGVKKQSFADGGFGSRCSYSRD